MQDFMKFLRCRLQVLVGDETDARVFMFGDVNILSTGMDAAFAAIASLQNVGMNSPSFVQLAVCCNAARC